MLPFKRSQRVGDLLRQEISDIIMRRMKDPRIGFITVTGVNVTDDLKSARVFVSVLKEEERELTLKVLNEARKMVRSELAKRVKLRAIPVLEFIMDEAIEYGSRIEKLLKDIKEEH